MMVTLKRNWKETQGILNPFEMLWNQKFSSMNETPFTHSSINIKFI